MFTREFLLPRAILLLPSLTIRGSFSIPAYNDDVLMIRRSGSVGIESVLWSVQSRNLGSTSGSGKAIYFPLVRPDRLWGPICPLLNVDGGSFSRSKVAGA